MPDLCFFDGVRVEDSRVAELCARTSEPLSYQILPHLPTVVRYPPLPDLGFFDRVRHGQFLLVDDVFSSLSNS
jgi:hypothetical protein